MGELESLSNVFAVFILISYYNRDFSEIFTHLYTKNGWTSSEYIQIKYELRDLWAIYNSLASEDQ